MSNITLTVKPIKKKDANRRLAAIDAESMEEIDVENGDFLEIGEGTGAIARVWRGYREDKGQGVIRIDGNIRKEADVSIDDSVSVRQVEAKAARRIEIALPKQLRVQGDLTPLIFDELKGMPVSEGSRRSLDLGISAPGPMAQGQSIPYRIEDTDPGGTVVVESGTEIVVTSKGLQRQSSRDISTETPSVTYEDIGGLDKELERVREMIEIPMQHPELFSQLGIEPPKGVLLHGPPGTGKTLMAKAVANEVDATFHTVSGPEIMSKFYGESEEQLRDVFEEASEDEPSVIFIDEIDSIAPKRGEATADVERRVVAQLLSLMDGLEERGEVVVIGATNRVNAIDSALRRGGRFDREIEIGVPDKSGREEIFHVHTRGMPLTTEIKNKIPEYSEKTHGFVGADIEALTKEAAMSALRRIRPELDLEQDQIDAESLEEMRIEENDFEKALKDIEPSALREVFVEVPDVTWSDVGGLLETKTRLQETVQWPLEYEDVFESMDIDPASGILMYGPPGTGKTLLAKAVANEAQSNFISVKGPELLNKYVGESEAGVRDIFSKARENAPTVIFFDEIDSLAGERGGTGSGVGERVVSQFLTELDGMESLEDVVVIATTNRPDLIDNALLRPGRLDRHISVSVPGLEARRRIFKVHTETKPVADNVDLDVLAEKTENYVGADIEAVCREASMNATREYINGLESPEDRDGLDETVITMDHFEQALEEVGASVDEEVKEKYKELEERFERTTIEKEEAEQSAFY